MIFEVIARTRRRLLWNAVAAQGARAVCISLGLLVLLLLLGTDILDWRYLLFVPVTALLADGCLTWRRLPDSYGAAQILDRRLGLQDAISTAWFYRNSPTSRPSDENMRQAQRAYTARLAETIDIRKALPLKVPRLVYAGAALALVGAGLVGFRYRIQGSLDLRPPAAPAIAQLIQSVTAQVANLEQWLRQFAPDRPLSERGKEQAKLKEKNDSPANPNSKNSAQANSGEDPGVEKQDTKMATDDPPKNQDNAAGEEQASNEGNSPQQGERGGRQGQEGQQKQASASNQDGSGSGSESSLLNKVRDTMANLLSAVKPQSGGRGGNRAEMERDAQQKNGKSNGKSGAGDQQQDASASQSQGEERGDGSQAQKGGSPSAGQAQSASSEKQTGTGAGRDEGNKEIRLAEQRAAMGKISVILGKRSKDVTGVTSMEVVSGEQLLQTRYENRKVKHGAVEDGGERDQVPIELQSYVRQYLQAARADSTGRSTGSASRAAKAETSATKQK